ncbi:hypothetical protein EAI_11896 [Harpegnathos saltator]|uniref:Uncharacterized protein n=1 Tax=Harpegnathos saltator TaxID=610380 RepID=E2BTW4_HARSA|nr:hypothetical protein EAI_11896 [Harpegnathos saltator]
MTTAGPPAGDNDGTVSCQKVERDTSGVGNQNSGIVPFGDQPNPIHSPIRRGPALANWPLKCPFRSPALSPHYAQINTRSRASALKLSRVSLPEPGVGEPEATQPLSVCWRRSSCPEIMSDRIDILAEVLRNCRECP